MTKIPTKVRKSIDADPRYRECALKGIPGHVCGGRITMEHALIYAGKQIQEKWAIVPVCAAGQEVDAFQDAHTMNKEMNVWVALNQATTEQLEAYPRAFPPYTSVRERLNKKYGVYVPRQVFPGSEINYQIIGL